MNTFESSPVTREFQNHKQVHLPDANIRVVAGVSGGPDSMAMLYLLHRFEVNTIVVHCNYQLRGKASDEDQKLVENICMHWNMECVSIRFNSGEEAQGNFQDWARQRRYLAFEDIKKEYGADLILTAHHQDDQVETILQKILRGAGIASWKGMDILERDLLRPFLNVSKSDIMEFVEDFNVPYRIDRTNEESTYARNFIRMHWFPDLNRFFPGWKKNLQRVTDRAEEFQIMSDTILHQLTERDGALNRYKYIDLHPKIRPVVLLHFIKKSGIETGISHGFLENADDLIDLKSGGKIQVSDRFVIIRDRSVFKIIEDSKSPSIRRKIGKDQLKRSLKVGNLKFSTEKVPDRFSGHSLHLDFDQLRFPLTLRTWKEGDIFQPFGMEGSQLVSDHLTNRKIPSDVKKQALVLEFFDDTICAVIFPFYPESEQTGTISDKVRCTPATTKTLTIRKIDQHGSISA